MAHTEKNSNYNIFSWNSYAWPEQLNCLENSSAIILKVAVKL